MRWALYYSLQNRHAYPMPGMWLFNKQGMCMFKMDGLNSSLTLLSSASVLILAFINLAYKLD